MVTAPQVEDATEGWAQGILEAGANVLRINASYGAPDAWRHIVGTFRSCAAALGIPVRVVVDLPGPKLRANINQREAGVLHVRRQKDAFGRTTAPASVPLVGKDAVEDALPVPPEWLSDLKEGDQLMLTQPSGRQRCLTLTRAGGSALVATCARSIYASSGSPLIWKRDGSIRARGTVGLIPDHPRCHTVRVGDRFLLSGNGLPGDPQRIALALSEPKLLAAIKSGERVILDDGRIVALAEAREDGGLRCRVTSLVKPSVNLHSGKGIAFPDSHLVLDAFGPADESALAFALEMADAVGVSFVNSASDVARVGQRIKEAGKRDFGMILKLETRGALHELAAILFEALRHEHVGLMIARGDLAVDLGFGRLAEMQEELLWFGEACHLPVVWATQVLETVAHTGLPTRAEITDAAMSMRAECVMLNKGPYITAANRLLADIIRKMEAHQHKKSALYRSLALATHDPPPP